MNEQENIEQVNVDIQKEWKVPLDINIISWFYKIIGIIAFFLGILLITGIAYTPKDYQYKVLGGIIVLQSNALIEISMLISGIMNFITGYFLKKGKKFGWYLALVGIIIALPDTILLSFSEHKLSAVIGLLMFMIIISWLIYRRQTYNIGISRR